MADQLDHKIKNWLETQGYPLEMKVAAELGKQDFFVSQGAYYTDPETDTIREIDVVATLQDLMGVLEVSFVIECKSTRQKPWVLFTSENHFDGNRLHKYAIKPQATQKILANKFHNDMDSVLDLKWFAKESRLAYGATTAFSSGEDPAYKGIMGALKASIGLCNKKDIYEPIKFIFPVVVLEGRLFETFLNETGECEVNEIENGFVIYHRKIADHSCSFVQVVASSGLENFCREAKETFQQIEKLFSQEIKEMLKNFEQGE